MGSTAFAAAATLISLAFCLSTLERWSARRRRHEMAWTIALLLFAAGSAALWTGASLGWSAWSFKLFYWAGAIVNVPVLALGTVYLLGGERRGDQATVAVALFGAFAAGWVAAAPIEGAIFASELPRGSEVFGHVPRVLAAVGSGGGSVVLLGGALRSALALLRSASTTPPGSNLGTAAPAPGPRRLAAANGLIAAGTLVLSAGGLLNSVLGEMDAFSVSLVAGIGLIFAGFLATGPATKAQRPQWVAEALSEPAGCAEPHRDALQGGRQRDRPHRRARRITFPPRP